MRRKSSRCAGQFLKPFLAYNVKVGPGVVGDSYPTVGPYHALRLQIVDS